MSETAEDLQARVAALEAENAALRSHRRGIRGPHRPRRSRAVLAVVLILLGVLLAPVAVVTGWAKWTLTDTERFVATYAPLADSPELQSYVVDQAMAAVDAEGGLRRAHPRARRRTGRAGHRPARHDRAADPARIGCRRPPLADPRRDHRVRRLGPVRHGVGRGVADRSPAADRRPSATTRRPWPRSATDGSLGIPLDPIVQRVKAELVERGITAAQYGSPRWTGRIVLVQSDQLPTGAGRVRDHRGRRHLAALGGAGAAGRRRGRGESPHRALLWAAGGFALVMALLAMAFAAGRIALVAAVPATVLPGSVSTLFYDAVTSGMHATAVAAAVLGLAVVAGGLAGGAVPGAQPAARALRDGTSGRLRRAADEPRSQHRAVRQLGASVPIPVVRSDRGGGRGGHRDQHAGHDLPDRVDRLLGGCWPSSS